MAKVVTKFLIYTFVSRKGHKTAPFDPEIQRYRGVNSIVLQTQVKLNRFPVDNPLGVGLTFGQSFLIPKMKSILCLPHWLLPCFDVTMNIKLLGKA